MNGSVPIYDDPIARGGVQAPALSIDVERGGAGYALLFLPFLFAWILSDLPTVSYLIAWSGSLWILYLTLSGKIKALPSDRSLFDQLMRPIVLTQVVFASYNFLTSIFYFMDVNGYYYFSRESLFVAPYGAVDLVAEAQRYYVLAHAGLATGMLMAMDYRKSGEWVVRRIENPTAFLLVLSGIAFVLAMPLTWKLGQLGERLEQISLVASVLALALAIPTRRFGLLVLAGTVYAVNLSSAFLSGYKENVLVMVILLAMFAYPYAKAMVVVGTPVALVFLLAILPTYADVFREMNWEGTASGEEAAAVAFETIQGGQRDLAANNWRFLTTRISEIELFTKYIESVRQTGSYYGLQIVDQSVSSLIPRFFWADKPITENIVMERVYENGVVSRESSVSAKPQYVVDGYLSAGPVGMLIAAFVFGWLASWASRICERYFGGYFWGTGLIYTSFFVIFWKGNSFEFLFNNVIWSFVLLVPLMYVARMTGLLHRYDAYGDPESVGSAETGGMRGFWAP